MFDKLKNKLKNWLSKSKEPEINKEKIVETQKAEEIKPITIIEPEKAIEETKKAIHKPILPETEKETEKEKSIFTKLFSKLKTTTLNPEQVDEIFEELELILLENNVALEVVDKIRQDLHKDLDGIEVKNNSIQEEVTNSLKKAISNALLEPEEFITKIKNKISPYTIVFFGINGSGKTTTIAKLAYKLKQNNISCILAAADTFRAASIEQLEIHAKNLKLPIIKHQYGSDPTSVAYDAIKYAEKHHIKCVLVDTAGRMYTKENLLKQMEKIIRVIKPDLKIFVGESITGNDAIEQAKTFNEAVGIDGIILSKADVDEKGGTALSVSYITKKPIYYLGVGQGMNDLIEFKKENILKNLGLN